MSDSEEYYDCDITEISEEIDGRPERPTWMNRSAFIVLAAIAVLCMPFLTWHQETEADGDVVSVVNWWPNAISYVNAEPAVWQRRAYDDGTVVKGALRKGRRHGAWSFARGGKETGLHYNNGNEIRVGPGK